MNFIQRLIYGKPEYNLEISLRELDYRKTDDLPAKESRLEQRAKELSGTYIVTSRGKLIRGEEKSLPTETGVLDLSFTRNIEALLEISTMLSVPTVHLGVGKNNVYINIRRMVISKKW